MSSDSKIEWCHHTFNPWHGCAKVHAGCKYCYAETRDQRNMHTNFSLWGRDAPRLMIKSSWANAVKWERDALRKGERYRVFCASMSDLFEDYDDVVCDMDGNTIQAGEGELSSANMHLLNNGMWTLSALRQRTFELMMRTPHLDWLVLTKRPENVCEMVPPDWLKNWPSNVMIGTSPCNQETTDSQIPPLLGIPCPRFLSVEPMIGPVEISKYISTPNEIHWVICGGESGAGQRRLMHINWVRSLRDECARFDIPFFFKQYGKIANNPDPNDPTAVRNGGSSKGGCRLDGLTYAEFPYSKSA